jgi:hypothetical protein
MIQSAAKLSDGFEIMFVGRLGGNIDIRREFDTRQWPEGF